MENNKLEWRVNIHKQLKAYFTDWENELPIIIIDTIDAAYLQGLEDGKKGL